MAIKTRKGLESRSARWGGVSSDKNAHPRTHGSGLLVALILGRLRFQRLTQKTAYTSESRVSASTWICTERILV